MPIPTPIPMRILLNLSSYARSYARSYACSYAYSYASQGAKGGCYHAAWVEKQSKDCLLMCRAPKYMADGNKICNKRKVGNGKMILKENMVW